MATTLNAAPVPAESYDFARGSTSSRGRESGRERQTVKPSISFCSVWGGPLSASWFRLAFLLVGVLFVPASLAHDYTRFSLPGGAIARLGRGSIGKVAYSPDDTRLAVAGRVGIWLYDAHTGAEVARLRSMWEVTPYVTPSVATGVHAPPTRPERTTLLGNYPNPFNSGTVISWFQLQPGPARLEMFALTGQRVAVRSRGHHDAGLHRLHWDGRDGRGCPPPLTRS